MEVLFACDIRIFINEAGGTYAHGGVPGVVCEFRKIYDGMINWLIFPVIEIFSYGFTRFMSISVSCR